MKLIDRYILREMTPPFFLGILAFTALILGVGGIYEIIRLATDHNVNIFIVARAFAFKLPGIITYTLPMSTLFCVLLIFNRMSADLEMTAMRAGGVGFFRALAPALAFAFGVSLFALFMNDRVVPAGNTHFNELIQDIETGGVLEKKNVLIQDADEEGRTARLIHIEEIKGRKLIHVSIEQFEGGLPVEFIVAEFAHWSRNNSLMLHEVQMYQLHPGGGKKDRQTATYVNTSDTMELRLSGKMDEMMVKRKQSEEMTVRELRFEIEKLKKQGVQPAIVRKVSVDFHSKIAIPFASLAFALIAAPLGLKPQRASSSVGLGVSVMIIFFYYIFQQMFRGLGSSLVAPALAAWMPNIFVFAIGVYLCSRADYR